MSLGASWANSLPLRSLDSRSPRRASSWSPCQRRGDGGWREASTTASSLLAVPRMSCDAALPDRSGDGTRRHKRRSPHRSGPRTSQARSLIDPFVFQTSNWLWSWMMCARPVPRSGPRAAHLAGGCAVGRGHREPVSPRCGRAPLASPRRVRKSCLEAIGKRRMYKLLSLNRLNGKCRKCFGGRLDPVERPVRLSPATWPGRQMILRIS